MHCLITTKWLYHSLSPILVIFYPWQLWGRPTKIIIESICKNAPSAYGLTCWWDVKHNSRGTKVEKMLTLAPERYTAGFCMVAKVILWCIWNHCIADLIDLHNARAVNFLRKPSKNMSKYYFSKCYIFLSKKFGNEKYWVHIIIQHRRRPQKQWWSS